MKQFSILEDLNKAATKALVVNAFPTCMPHYKTFAEDDVVAQCFRNKLQVFPFDTKDEDGGERYMPFAVSSNIFIALVIFQSTVHLTPELNQILSAAGSSLDLQNSTGCEIRLVCKL